MTTAPGVDEIAQRMRADGLGAGVAATLEVSLGRVAAALDKQENRRRRLAQLVTPAPFIGAVPLTAGAGTLDQRDRYGPMDGFFWDLRRITVDGFTAGSVAVYVNDTNTPRAANFPQPGDFTWSGQRFLFARDRLIFVATGITGTVQFSGDAINVSMRLYPEYVL